jgi:hypothetical protein
MDTPLLIAGLGNPGSQYAKNRHNAGFIVADELHAHHKFGPWKAKFDGLLSEGVLAGRKTYLLKPQTFMNLSGGSVAPVLKFYKIPLDALVVIHDMGFKMRHRRAAERGQVDPLQRADADRGGAGGELSVLHHRAERGRGGGARIRAWTSWRRLRGRKQIIPTRITFVDIAGLVRGASKGEGLGNQFLANIREVDAIAHVLRCFEDGDITHVEGRIDPVADAETIETELMLADLESLDCWACITYFTVGPKEARAWTIQGHQGPQARRA